MTVIALCYMLYIWGRIVSVTFYAKIQPGAS